MNGFVVPKPYGERGSAQLLKLLKLENLIDFIDHKHPTKKIDVHSHRKSAHKSVKLQPIPETRLKHGVIHPNKPRVRHTNVRRRIITVPDSDLNLQLRELAGEDEIFSEIDLNTDREREIEDNKQPNETKSISFSDLNLHHGNLACEDKRVSEINLTDIDKKSAKEPRCITFRIKRFLLKCLCPFSVFETMS